MFQFTTYHNPESFETLEEMVENITNHGLTVKEQSYSQGWDETTLILEGTRDQFEKFFLSDGDSSQSIDIDEFMEELVEI
jgi:hypothetical protein